MPPLTQTQNNTIDTANTTAKINADILTGNQKPPVLPITKPVEVPSIGSFLQPQVNPQEQQQIDTLSTQSNDIFEQLYGAQDTKATRGATVTALEESAGIPRLNVDLADIQNQIMQKELQFRQEREALTNRGGLASQVNAALADVSRKQSSELANLEVVRAARSNSLNAIQSIIDRKVERQFADEDARINNLKFIYDNVKGDLTKAQDRKYQETITRENRAFEMAKSKFEQVENAKAELIKNAQINGANTATMQKIMNAPDLAGAYSAAGSFGLSIDEKIKKAQYSQKMNELSSTIAGASLSDGEITGIPSQDIAKVIDKTGAKSTKGITDALGVIKGVETFAQKNPEGRFVGMAPIRFLPAIFRGKDARKERQTNLGDISAINLKVEQWASGASLTDAQTKKVKKMVPDKNDTDFQARNKINQLTNYMIGQVQGELASQGIQSIPTTFDFFSDTASITTDQNGNVVIPGEATEEDFWNK